MERERNLSTLWPELLALAAGQGEGAGAADSAARLLASLRAPGRGPGRLGFVIGQLGQSLDGRIATPAGHSHYINGPEAILHLHRLRALVDAVIVGAGTVVADDPRLTVRLLEARIRRAWPSIRRAACRPPPGYSPMTARAVFVVQASDRRGRPRDGHQPRCRDGRFDPHAIVAALAKHGLRRLLIEGGGERSLPFSPPAPRSLARLRCPARNRIGTHGYRPSPDRPPRGGTPASGLDPPPGRRRPVRLCVQLGVA